MDPSIIQRLTSISRRLRGVEAKNDELSQKLIEAYIRSDSKNKNETIVGNAPFTNNTQLTVPSIYNYMSHLLGSKNSLVPTFERSSGRRGGIWFCVTDLIVHWLYVAYMDIKSETYLYVQISLPVCSKFVSQSLCATSLYSNTSEKKARTYNFVIFYIYSSTQLCTSQYKSPHPQPRDIAGNALHLLC